ncbi:MAG: hypothetical protein H6Q70_2355 [Firmicutes bacterium]|nr:hypothetical protein [Bacillota bacterium]
MEMSWVLIYYNILFLPKIQWCILSNGKKKINIFKTFVVLQENTSILRLNLYLAADEN